ncbi:hypothetical protein QTP86_033557, partial [Hemibagrus guttatus]
KLSGKGMLFLFPSTSDAIETDLVTSELPGVSRVEVESVTGEVAPGKRPEAAGVAEAGATSSDRGCSSATHAVKSVNDSVDGVQISGNPKKEQMSEEGNAALSGALSLEELYKALQGMESGRAPGIDGLPVDFYKSFWTELRGDLLQVLNDSLSKGKMPTVTLGQMLNLAGSSLEKPDSLSRVWVAGAPAHDRYPKNIAPDPYAPSCGWWAYGKVGLRRFFGLCPAESRRQRFGHQALACVPQLQGGAPVTPVRAT